MSDSLENYRPTEFVKDLSKIDFEKYARIGVRYWIIDLDDTTGPSNQYSPDIRLVQYILDQREAGHIADIVSMSNLALPIPYFLERHRYHAQMLNAHQISLYFWNGKPRPNGILQAMHLMNSTRTATGIIGDQVRKDILAGNLAKLAVQILVTPLSPGRFFTRLNRPKEERILNDLGLV